MPTQATRQFALPDDLRASARETLKAMRLFVLDGKRQIDVRRLALSIVAPCPPMHWRAEMQAVLHWVRRNVRYVRDANGIEQLHFADTVLDQAAADCDDMTILICALLESIGHETRSVAVSFDGDNYSHVFAQAHDPDSQQWLTLDATVEHGLGWFPPDVDCIMRILNAECPA